MSVVDMCIHCVVEVTKLSTNKHLCLSQITDMWGARGSHFAHALDITHVRNDCRKVPGEGHCVGEEVGAKEVGM
jgi:hypothetical protein